MRLKKDAILEARASPPCFSGNIRIMLSTTFKSIALTAVLTGVFVSFIE